MSSTPSPLTLETYPLATGYSVDPTSFVNLIYANGKQPAYTRDIVVRIADALDKYSRMFSDDGRCAAGQVIHETDYLRYTGDVTPEQYNFGGIGATGGIKGEFYPSPEDGVLALFAHRSIYMRGEWQMWPISLQGYHNASHRYDIAVAAGKAGVVHQIKDFGNGNWAVGPKYAEALVRTGNLLVAGGTVPRTLKFAIGAGHRNTSGGNPRERSMTGPLTNMYVNIARQWGVDVRCYTPQDGLGEYPGPLHAAVNEVNKWAAQGWVPDMYIEVHFQGLSEGTDAGRGFFHVYPDWPAAHDTDTDARDKFTPLWIPEYQSRTNMPAYGSGSMSERRTAVGAAGDRLGVFSVTVGLKASTTRMIVEHGCHTCPSDYALMQQPDYNKKVVEAFLTAWFKMEGMPLPAEQPPAPYTPTGPGAPVDGAGGSYWLIGPFLTEYQTLGQEFVPTYGLVSSGMVRSMVDGKLRYIQFTEKGAMTCYPADMPDGVPEGNPFFIRNVFPHERIEALEYAKETGQVRQDLT